MPKIGPLELVVILVVVLMVFGVGRLPQVGKAIGKSVRAIRNTEDDGAEDVETKKTAKKTKSKAAKKKAVAELPPEDKTQST
jgi:sec-independent protein translocase protein TatA